MSKVSTFECGVGLDIGTMNIVSARKSGDTVSYKRVRDAFLDLDSSAKKMLKKAGVRYLERLDDLIVVGDQALEYASIFNKEARRPLVDGLISSRDQDSLEIINVLISQVLGKPTIENELCYFSVPSAPVDANKDVVYHKGVFEKIVKNCGYTPRASNEAMAVIYACGATEKFSGIGISFGSGMTNIALSYNALSILEFSLSRGGDWIDNGVAGNIGSTRSRICTIKEQGVDLLDPKTNEQEAISFYYKSLIEYSLQNIAKQFKLKCDVALKNSIPIFVSGGTSKAKNFLTLFTDTFKSIEKKFPIQISDIRPAEDPLNAVAQGLLVQAQEEYED